MPEDKSMAALDEELTAATAEFAEAERATSIAVKSSTAALNRVNQAQDAMDAAIAARKKAAPRASDWARPR